MKYPHLRTVPTPQKDSAFSSPAYCDLLDVLIHLYYVREERDPGLHFCTCQSSEIGVLVCATLDRRHPHRIPGEVRPLPGNSYRRARATDGLTGSRRAQALPYGRCSDNARILALSSASGAAPG